MRFKKQIQTLYTESAFARCFFTLVKSAIVLSACVFHFDALAENGPRIEQKEIVRKTTQPRFNIWEVRVKGNTALDAADIERVVYSAVGPLKSVKDIHAAADALEKLYERQGYPGAIVSLPPQDLREGIVYFVVSEPVVERLRVSGSKYHLLSLIKDKLPSLDRGQLYSVQDVQKDLAIVNRLSSDLKVSPIYKAGKRRGGIDVDLQVNDNLPVHGAFELNNRHSSSTVEERLMVNLSYTNLWQKFHTFSLQYQVSPEDTEQVSVLVGTYLFPVNKHRDRIAAYAVKSESNVPSLLDSVLGDGQVLGARYVAILPSAGFYSHNVSAGFDYKEFEDTILFSGDGASDDTEREAFVTPIRYGQFVAQYTGTFSAGFSRTRFNLSSTFGLSGLSDEHEFADKRSADLRERAQANYVYSEFGFEQSFSFGGWRLKLGGNGQYSEDLLISNEQFVIGGEDSVRGYFESMHLGDVGTNGYLEFWAPNVFGDQNWSHRWLRVKPYLFYDTANTRVIKTTTGDDIEESEFSLDSAGLGLDIVSGKKFTAVFQWAQALVNSGDIERGDERVHFNLQYQF